MDSGCCREGEIAELYSGIRARLQEKPAVAIPHLLAARLFPSSFIHNYLAFPGRWDAKIQLTYRRMYVSAGNRTWAACVTGEHSSKDLFEQLMLLLFGTSTPSYLESFKNNLKYFKRSLLEVSNICWIEKKYFVVLGSYDLYIHYVGNSIKEWSLNFMLFKIIYFYQAFLVLERTRL